VPTYFKTQANTYRHLLDIFCQDTSDGGHATQGNVFAVIAQMERYSTFTAVLSHKPTFGESIHITNIRVVIHFFVNQVSDKNVGIGKNPRKAKKFMYRNMTIYFHTNIEVRLRSHSLYLLQINARIYGKCTTSC
jgi:hypothetical protein